MFQKHKPVKRVVARVRAGPAWDGGPIREQPGWDAHAAFIDDLIERARAQ